jgi:large subunit ribosomal protein L15
MEAYTLKKPEHIKRRKRVGRGPGSGHGKTCCRGQDGQGSRSGYSKRPWFEGGQMPLQRRVPKRGFNNIFKKDFQVINIEQIDKIKETEIDPVLMKKMGIINDAGKAIKILGNGEIKASKKVIADAFSKSAQEKIISAGGSIEIREKIQPEKKDK